MHPIVLHDHPLSSNAQKIRLMLELTAQPYELREVPFELPRADWHLAVNPSGGIPAIVDGDVRLAESNAILRYLADRAGRDDLLPRDPADRARVDWILDLWATAIRPALFGFEAPAFGIVPGFGLGATEPAPADEVATLFAKAAPRLESSLAVLDQPGPWACLGRMTIADVAAAPALHRYRHAPIDHARLPRLTAWAEACAGIPEWAPLAAISGVPAGS
jgi:glutathione S-transferase